MFSIVTLSLPKGASFSIVGNVVMHSRSQMLNITEARRIGFKGYVTQTIENHTGPVRIPATGGVNVTVDLWFVSYDWGNATETNVTVAPKMIIGNSDEWTGFESVCEPSGEMILTVNEPARLRVTLSVPRCVGHDVVIGDNFSTDLVNVKSSYAILASSYSEDVWELKASVNPTSVTNENTLRLTVYNPGPSSIWFGDEYHIEKWVNGTWREVQLRNIWLTYLLGVIPGSTLHQTIDLRGLSSGVYRVYKDVERQGVWGRIYEDFTVSRPA